MCSSVPERATAQHGPDALPEDRLVEDVPPPRAHLRQCKALLVREVLEEARQERRIRPELVKHHKPEKGTGIWVLLIFVPLLDLNLELNLELNLDLNLVWFNQVSCLGYM